MDTISPRERVAPPLAERFLEPPGWQWGHFPTARGAQLRWGHLATPGATRTCVLVGGFTEFIEKYFETARDFAARRFDVWCLDWHGQGASARAENFPSRPLSRDYDRDADDLAAFIEAMTPPGQPRLLVAHSMGGAIAMLCLHRHCGIADAAVLSAPMFGLPMSGVIHWLARALAAFNTRIGRGDHFVLGAGAWKPRRNLSAANSPNSHDPDRCLLQRTWFEHDPLLRVDGPTYGWVHSAFGVTARLRDPKLLTTITTPILLGSAGKEIFVSAAAHRLAAGKLPNCELVEFPNAKHELFHEADDIRHAWFAAIDRFVVSHLTKG